MLRWQQAHPSSRACPRCPPRGWAPRGWAPAGRRWSPRWCVSPGLPQPWVPWERGSGPRPVGGHLYGRFGPFPGCLLGNWVCLGQRRKLLSADPEPGRLEPRSRQAAGRAPSIHLDSSGCPCRCPWPAWVNTASAEPRWWWWWWWGSA